MPGFGLPKGSSNTPLLSSVQAGLQQPKNEVRRRGLEEVEVHSRGGIDEDLL